MFDDVDLLDLDRWEHDGPPFAAFARLRNEAPVWRHPSPTADGSPGFWVVTGYDEVVALGRCPHAMSSDEDNGGVTGLGPGDELQEVFDTSLESIGLRRGSIGSGAKHLLTLDPPEHTQYRKIVNRGFTPRMIGLLEDRVRSELDLLLDTIDPDEPVDFTERVSSPLPIHVIADMLGAPRADHAQLVQWSNEAVASTDPEYATGPFGQIAAAAMLAQYFRGLREERTSDDGDDLLSVLMRAEIDGEGLNEQRFAMFMILLVVAGNETTRTSISHAVMELAARPGELERLRDDPALIPAAVEEVLRFASPVMYFRRNAIADMEVGGQHIAAGDIVSLWYIAANRAAEHFDDPDRFDVGRTPNHHVAFGGGGPHFCLGASLARLETRVLLEAVVERYRRIEPAGPVRRVRGNFLNGIKHLPVRLVAS